MRILLLATAYNGLCQRAHVALAERDHDVRIALSLSDDVMRDAVATHQPDIIICPFLKEKVPDDIWRNHLCIIIHPGIKGDRGPSSLDWAIMEQAQEWGVTALQAHEEMDAGDIWATATFPMRTASKASLYRKEVTSAGIDIILQTVERFASRDFTPEPLDYAKADVQGRLRPVMKQHERAIDWSQDTTATIVRKISAADSSPGVLDHFCGGDYYLYGIHEESQLTGKPGEVIAQRYGAICRATVDGAVWISHLRKKKAAQQRFFKLPATQVLGDAVAEVPEVLIPSLDSGDAKTFRDICYQEKNEVGYLYFDFYNGAMSTDQCRRLQLALLQVRQRPIKVIALMGGDDFWSNGIHLNVIEAADNPAAESWRNINAIDDLVQTILRIETHWVIAALRGNAGAGGVIQALAADQVVTRSGVVLNPHYQSMRLFGSEYWTYLLPKRVGWATAQELTESCLPIGANEAKTIGLVDEVIAGDEDEFQQKFITIAETLAQSSDFSQQLEAKVAQRRNDEACKPLAAYRAEELARMSHNFFGPDRRYHQVRRQFVYKAPATALPEYLANYNQSRQADQMAAVKLANAEVA